MNTGQSIPDKSEVTELRRRLHHFLEIQTNSKISNTNDGALIMLIRHAKTSNVKIKDKMINYKLAEIEKRLLNGKELNHKNFIICEFLIEEVEKYIKSKL